MSKQSGIAVLGIYVADTAYMAHRLPKIGETILGSGFALGPGGKGSNQAVAASHAGADVDFISKIGNDPFGQMALKTYEQYGVNPQVEIMDDTPTGAAFVFVNDQTGDNAIIVSPGAAGTISVADIEARRDIIASKKIFITQLEQPADAALAALQIAHDAGVTTVFNPAPANEFDPAIYPLCDYIAPNESEAAALVGFEITTAEDARRAGDILLERGAKTALITMGSQGVYVHSNDISELVPAFSSAAVVDTTGAGDAFIGGFSAALAADKPLRDAIRFGCATAGIAVTRRGTAHAMPDEDEILHLLDTAI